MRKASRAISDRIRPLRLVTFREPALSRTDHARKFGGELALGAAWMRGPAREEIGHHVDSIETEIRSGKGNRASVRIWGVERRRQEFTEFYTSSRDDCLRIVLVSVGDRQMAEDLVAEAFTRAWRSWRTVREHPVPRAWVVRTALNTHVSWWRRRRREQTVDGRTALTLLDSTQHCPSADFDLDEGLAAAVRALPARQREVVTLRVFFDLDTDATAKLLGISAGTVGAHLHRALAALRTQIQSFSDQGVTR